MIERATPVTAAPGTSAPATSAKPLPGAIGPTAARLVEAMARSHGDVLFIAGDERRAEAVAALTAAMAPDLAVALFPAWDSMPYDRARPSTAVMGRRAATLARLAEPDRAPLLLVTTVEASVQRVAGEVPAAIMIRTGEPIDPEDLSQHLATIGYRGVDRVDEPGEMVMLGQRVDVFPAAAAQPVRIDIEDGRVAAIRNFDAATQRSADDVEPLGAAKIGPAIEGEGPLVSLFTLMPGADVAIDPGVTARRDAFLDDVADAWTTRSAVRDVADAFARTPPDRLYLDAGEWGAVAAARRAISVVAGEERATPRFVERRDGRRALLRHVAKAVEAGRTTVFVGSARDLRFIGRQVEQALGQVPTPGDWAAIISGDAPAIRTLVGPLDRGWETDRITVVAAADVLGHRAGDGTSRLEESTTFRDDFRIGDALIHSDHGLGILRGIETLGTGDHPADAIRLEYAGDTKRLVPVEEAGRLWRYGADAAVTLDRLDGTSWAKRRADIDIAIAATARTLVAVAHERQTTHAPVLEPDVAAYEKFAARFAFAETVDQGRAIEAVRADLASGRPMERLVVGDVGYGKTEVALRAAAFTALAGKQVAIVAPTTVLVRQHLETFTRRFAGFGIGVAGLSRLSTPAEARAVKAGLADGSIGIVVGTHAVAGKGVAFADLALVVIDEEQRFGTASKAKLRALAEGVHVLCLTATPIPRTLQAALVGLNDLSTIATPPARRQPIRTFTGPFDAATVRGALMREHTRGGQSFVVCPRIEDIGALAEQLRELVPELKILIAHGKLPTGRIDATMIDFAGGDGDVLLATNIIEAGLDVPRANTMLVCRADRFGLAQLHQLRGRVGRGRVRGVIHLLTDPGATPAPATLKRLATLTALDQLGAGFAISARDLDMRGAGELLGDEQAGHMKLIGADLYQHLLAKAVRVARGEAVDDWVPELNLEAAGSLPADYIPDAEIRIGLYARLARLESAAEIDDFEEEVVDRFGALPAAARGLILLARARRLAVEARIARIDAGPAAIALTPRPDFDPRSLRTIDGVGAKGDRVIVTRPTEAGEARAAAVVALLAGIADND